MDVISGKQFVADFLDGLEGVLGRMREDFGLDDEECGLDGYTVNVSGDVTVRVVSDDESPAVPTISRDTVERIKEKARRVDVKTLAEFVRWPAKGDKVYYLKGGKICYGHVAVVCHNTIQLDNNVSLDRSECFMNAVDLATRLIEECDG